MRGPLAAILAVGALVTTGCGELSRIVDELAAKTGAGGTGGAAPGGTGGAGGAAPSTEELPAPADAAGCNVRLTPTAGLAAPAALASAGPWQLCGAYGTGAVTSTKTSADGRRVAALTDSGQAWVLDAHTFRLLGTFSHGTGPISALALSSDGRLLATVDAPGHRLALWDVASRTLLRAVTVATGTAQAYYGLADVAFSHDGTKVAVGSTSRVDVIDVGTGTALPIGARTDVGGAMRVAFAAGDTRLVLGRFQYFGNGPYAGWGAVDLVDAATGDNATRLDKFLYIQLPAIAVSADGNTVAVGATEPGQWPITFFDARTGQRTGELAVNGVPLALDASAARLALIEPPADGASAPGAALTVSVRRVADGGELNRLAVAGSTAYPRGKQIAVTPDLTAALVGAVGPHVLERIGIASGNSGPVACGAGHITDVTALALSRDGGTLVSTGDFYDNFSQRLWDVASGAEAAGPPPADARQPSATSPDGTLVAQPTDDAFASTFDLRSTASGETVRTLGPQPSRPRAFDFSPDGTLIASTSERDPADRYPAPVATIWDVATGGAQQSVRIVTPQPETNPQPVLFDDSGRRLFVGGYGTIAVWCR